MAYPPHATVHKILGPGSLGQEERSQEGGGYEKEEPCLADAAAMQKHGHWHDGNRHFRIFWKQDRT